MQNTRILTLGFRIFVVIALFMSVNNFRVCLITLKPPDIFSWNFTQTLNTIRGCAEYMNRNSGFPTFSVTALCVLKIFVSTQ